MRKKMRTFLILGILITAIFINPDSFARRIKESPSLSDWLAQVTQDLIGSCPMLSHQERMFELLKTTLAYVGSQELRDLRLARDGDYNLYYVFMIDDISTGENINVVLDAENGRLIQEGSFKDVPPEALRMSEYDLLKSFSIGGSAAKTFLAIKRSGDPDSPDRLVVVKFADKYGVDGVGMPVLEAQALRLMYLRHVVASEIEKMEDLTEEEVEQMKNFFPEVIGFSINRDLYVYYTMPYRPGETLTEYFMKNGVTVEDFIALLDQLLTDMSITLKARDNVRISFDAGIEHIMQWHIGRIERRFKLLQQREGAMFEESIRGNPVRISGAEYPDITYLFEELLVCETVTINGTEYPNIPVLIDEIKNDPDLLEVLAPAFISRLSHGDLIIRNIFKEDTGHFRLIDIKGMEPPDEALDPLYGISKMVFGFGYDLIREGLYDLEVRKEEDGGFAFDLSFDGENPIVAKYLEAIELALRMVEDNAEFNQVMNADIHWKKRLAFSVAAHFIGDLACHLEPDKSGQSSLALYAIGTVLLDDFLRHLDIDLSLIFN